jgi:hypothetical protein
MKNIFRANHEFIALGRIGLLVTALVLSDFLVSATISLIVLMFISWKFPAFISAVKYSDQIKFYLMCASLGAIGWLFRTYFDSSLYGLLIFIPYAIYIQNWLRQRTEGLIGVKEYNEIVTSKNKAT